MSLANLQTRAASCGQRALYIDLRCYGILLAIPPGRLAPREERLRAGREDNQRKSRNAHQRPFAGLETGVPQKAIDSFCTLLHSFISHHRLSNLHVAILFCVCVPECG